MLSKFTSTVVCTSLLIQIALPAIAGNIKVTVLSVTDGDTINPVLSLSENNNRS
ncbi:hypothetical protein LC593_35345 [Nostoc sp. CHAB 5844]|nr:hypothetical protein [Nostoc sp. CHAB 5844]